MTQPLTPAELAELAQLAADICRQRLAELQEVHR